MAGKRPASGGYGKLAAALAVLAVVILGPVATLLSLDAVWPGIYENLLVYEGVSAAFAVLGVLVLGGWRAFVPTADDLRGVWRLGRAIILISFVLMVMQVVGYCAQGTPVSDRWLPNVAYCLVVCLAIGVFEEAMLRGIALGGLLAAFGRRRSGMVVAVALTALAFGCMHVDWTTTDVADPLQLAQALLKIAQTGIYSVVLSACVMRSGSLVGVSLYHALDDFLLMVVSNGIFGEAMSTEYVSKGDDAPVTVIFYVVLVALYVPSLVRAVRELSGMSLPQLGPLVREGREVDGADEGGATNAEVAPVNGGEARPPVGPPDPRV